MCPACKGYRFNRCLKLKEVEKIKGGFPGQRAPSYVITYPVGSGGNVGEVKDELGYTSAPSMPL